MRSVKERLRRLLKREAPPVEPTPPPIPPKKIPPAPQSIGKAAAKPSGGVVLVTVLGLGGDPLEGVLDLVERECRKRGTRPVFVTDRQELTAFRRRRLIVEQVVDAEAKALGAPDLAWPVYRRRQYALLAARWRPATTISFGRRPEPACLAVLGVPA
ncbi:MAG: hypothetical protein U1E45_21995 [Geminicoccaceae bacterium]